MVTKDSTFEELRGLGAISQACLNATIQKGWKCLGEMMGETGTVSGLRGFPSLKSRFHDELIDVMDRLPVLDRSLADYLLIDWERVESLEGRFNELAAMDESGSEVKRCFTSAWELRTLAIYEQEALEERLSAYPPLVQKKMLLWAIDCFNALAACSQQILALCPDLSGLEVACEFLKGVVRRYCFVHEQKPFPEWDDFVRFEFEDLAYMVRVKWFQTAAKDPAFVDQFVGSVHLPEKAFLETMAQRTTRRKAETSLHRFVTELIDVMSDWERAPKDKRIAFTASAVMGACLSKRDESVLFELHERLGYMPLFFLACRLLGDSHGDPDFVFAVTNGIIEDPENRMAEIRATRVYSDALLRSWSKGRIRDLTLDKLNRWDWSVYPELNGAFFLHEEDPLWERIREEERVTTTFEGFGALLGLTHGFVMERVNGRRLLVNPKKLPGFSVAAFAKRLDRVLGGSYTESVRIAIRELAGPHADPLPLDQLTRLATWLTGRDYQEGMIELSRNHVNVEEVFVRFLQERGEPLRRQELLDRFREEYPDLELSDYTLLGSLYGNPRFVARQATGLYALSEWGSSFHKSVGDLVEELLRGAGGPLTIEELHEQVVKEFTSTSPQSMDGCLRADTRKRFVKLPNRRIGLANAGQ